MHQLHQVDDHSHMLKTTIKSTHKNKRVGRLDGKHLVIWRVWMEHSHKICWLQGLNNLYTLQGNAECFYYNTISHTTVHKKRTMSYSTIRLSLVTQLLIITHFYTTHMQIKQIRRPKPTQWSTSNKYCFRKNLEPTLHHKIPSTLSFLDLRGHKYCLLLLPEMRHSDGRILITRCLFYCSVVFAVRTQSFAN